MTETLYRLVQHYREELKQGSIKGVTYLRFGQAMLKLNLKELKAYPGH